MKDNQFSDENFHLLLKDFLKKNSLTVDKVSKAIDCPRSSIDRILLQLSKPSDRMMKQAGIMFALGFEEYKSLSSKKKEKISESIGSIGGGVLGFGAISSAISASGIAGLAGGAAITSGLAGLGTLIGGGMAAGVAVAAAIPLAGVGVGYGVVKGVKYFVGNKNRSRAELDPIWEKPFE